MDRELPSLSGGPGARVLAVAGGLHPLFRCPSFPPFSLSLRPSLPCKRGWRSRWLRCVRYGSPFAYSRRPGADRIAAAEAAERCQRTRAGCKHISRKPIAEACCDRLLWHVLRAESARALIWIKFFSIHNRWWIDAGPTTLCCVILRLPFVLNSACKVCPHTLVLHWLFRIFVRFPIMPCRRREGVERCG